MSALPHEELPEIVWSDIAIPDIQGGDDGQRAAFRYVKNGLYIGPIRHGAKDPSTVLGRWTSKTFNDSESVVMWWEQGDHGVFLHAGRSGLVALDVDTPEKVPADWWPYLNAAPYQNSRPGTVLRGHYLFAVPPGRLIGNALGATGRLGWGEVRGLNGIIVVAPTRHEKHEDGARYHWVRTGPVPMLPDVIGSTLPDGKPGEACATDSEINTFLSSHTETDPLGDTFKTHAVARYHQDVEKGRSRHEAAVSSACWIAREAAAGWYNAREALLLLNDAFKGSFTEQERKQFRGGRSEFRSILSWAVGQVTPEDVENRRARLEQIRTRRTGGPDQIIDSWTGEVLGPAPARWSTTEEDVPIDTADATSSRRADPVRYFLDKTMGFDVALLADDVLAEAPAALGTDRDGVIWVYENGVYRPDDGAISMVVTELLGGRYRTQHEAALQAVVKGRLRRTGTKLPMLAPEPVLNCKNGMLMLRTGDLVPHDPAWQSTWQIPVAWDPAATCPTYEQWLKDVIPDQIDDLEETVAQMLDASSIPRKAALLYGPSRSGKSTMQRLVTAMIGDANRSAVALDHLTGTDHKFKVAEMHGKRLNSSGDLPVMDVGDVALFKQLTGGDPVTVEKKGRQPFAFINQALMLFSANSVPSVGETSDAYMQRMRPFAFSRSFAGHEDRTIEARMLMEMPGILARWVRAWQRYDLRGDFGQVEAGVAKEFAVKTNRVRQFVEEACRVRRFAGAEDGHSAAVALTPGSTVPIECGSTLTVLYEEYKKWCLEGGMKPSNKTNFTDRLKSLGDSLGLIEVRVAPTRSRGFNITVRRDA